MNLEIIFALIAVVITLLQLTAIYFVFKSSKVMSGILASAFYKIGIGVSFLIIAAAFLGWGWGYFKMASIPLFQLPSLGLNIMSAIFLFLGFKQLYNILNGLSKKR